MTPFQRTATVLGFLALAPFAAQAVELRVTVTGTVDFNVIGGGMAGTPSGAPVSMGFTVNSDSFLNSLNFPTRGYAIDLASFSMTVGTTAVSLNNPQAATAYFVLRNNDPAVDGFFLSLNGVELPAPLAVRIPGLTPVHELSFSHTLIGSSTLSSLNILDAVGTYNLASNVSAYSWGIGRFGNFGAEYVPGQLSISVVPEPASVLLLGLGGLLIWQRVKRQAA